MNCGYILLTDLAIIAVLAGPGISQGQSGHVDVLTLQENGRLITGESVCNDTACTTQQTVLRQRVFSNEFPAQFFVTKPGFASPGTGSIAIPAGTQALPSDTPLSWDFLPFSIDGIGRNLFYWDGQDTDGQAGITPADVAFGAPPGSNYLLSLYDQANTAHSVSGTNVFVTGGSVGKTDALGHIHQHRTFTLQDLDGDSALDGIYLLSIHMRVAGLADSLPLFLLFGTENSSVDALDNASVPWVEQQLDLPGDYNGDGVVDAADYPVWRDSLGQMGPALTSDGDGDQSVGVGDYEIWRLHFGTSAALQVPYQSTGSATAFLAVGIPEPMSLFLLFVGVNNTLVCRMRRRKLTKTIS